MAAMGFTPGPNNILVASSGVNFGFRASVCTWTLFGHLLRDDLNTERRRRIFNFGMAGLLVVSIIPVVWE